MTSRSALSLASLIMLVGAAGCVASADSSSERAVENAAALKLQLCPFGTYGSRDPDTGQLVCVEVAPSGTNLAACTGTRPVPLGLSGKGCIAGTTIVIQPLLGTIPVWLCPSAATIPTSLGVVAGGTLPTCLRVNGIPKKLSSGCATTATFTQMSDSCVGDAPTNWKYVIEEELADDVIGTSCGGGCSRVGTVSYGP